jgi:alkanesulfonate monooxygenase SsuD/methylene tetrahydromethanopterin reductase-like flavin-dependent oxidoreductase (luciferase family)
LVRSAIFFMPCHPPERPLAESLAYDLECMRWADELGIDEVWVGEHHTLPWEPVVAPDQLLAQAALVTERVRIGAAGHLIPYVHPVALANRVSQLDHLSGGRVNFAAITASTPSDHELFGLTGGLDVSRRMTAEGFDLMLKVWTSEEPFSYDGEFWKGEFVPNQEFGGPWLKPLQRPHPPIAVPGLGAPSPSHEWGGARGYSPISFNISERIVEQHWASYTSGAESAGRTPDRSQWRILKDVFVAETDEEAYEQAIRGPLARFYNEYQLPLLTKLGYLSLFKEVPDVPDASVDVDYLNDTMFLIGSPDTVVEKLTRTYERFGGFGTLMVLSADYADDPGPWRRSLELLTQEVLPRVAHLDGS